MTFEAANLPGVCLVATSTIWPVPVGRNYVVQLQPCGAQTAHWVFSPLAGDGSGGQVHTANAPDQCLDALAPPPPSAPVTPCCSNATAKSLPFCRATLSPAERAADLVSRLTVAELAGSLTVTLQATETPAGTTKVNQRKTAGCPRLGVPGIEFSEACHGVLSGCLAGTATSTGCPTSFPMPIAQAASFNETLWSAVGTAISVEGRALFNGGVNGVTYFAPNVNCVRDPRWGRGYETAGEDALVNGRFAVAFVRALQGNDTESLRAVATCKHSLLYDVEQNRGTNSLHAPQRDLTDYYLVPFEFCIKRARVSSVMCQYGAMDDVPSCANGKINNGIYRDTYGFDGFVVSDCDSVGGFSHFPPHPDGPHAAAEGVLGGLDVDCGTSYQTIPAAVTAGLLPDKAVRTAAERFYAKQIAAGMLDHSPFDGIGADAVDSAEHRALAVEAAGQSLVLLKADGPRGATAGAGGAAGAGSASAKATATAKTAVVPLPASSKLALIGVHADSTVDLLGNYHGVNLQVLSSSVVDVAARRGLDFTHVPGGGGPAGIADAVAAAKAADTAVLFLGLSPRMEGEGHDRTTLGLPQDQVDLATNVSAAQPRTAVVLINGGALAVEPLVSGPHEVPVVIEAFYPGQGGAEAIWAALLGERNTWGKLPYTMYPSTFVKRNVLNFNLTDDGGITYRHYDGKYGAPLFEFGHGLSYTTFSYEWASRPPADTVRVGDLASSPGCYDCSRVRWSVRVTNTGGVAGDAVVLGFVKSPGGVRSLFDFARVSLASGASATVRLAMDRGCTQAVADVDAAGTRWVRPGVYRVQAGDVAAPVEHTLTVTGAAGRVNPSCA